MAGTAKINGTKFLRYPSLKNWHFSNSKTKKLGPDQLSSSAQCSAAISVYRRIQSTRIWVPIGSASELSFSLEKFFDSMSVSARINGTKFLRYPSFRDWYLFNSTTIKLQLTVSAYGSPPCQSLKEMLKRRIEGWERRIEGWESRSDSRAGVGRPQESASSGLHSRHGWQKT